jgi:X-X-X-Leu-X-X-Gly heptad repeat protein
MATCPPVEHLVEFASGSLGDEASGSIESHIDTCGDCRAALSALARGEVAPTFGRYRIDTVLGSGGMGIVYRAWDPQLARPVAIKVLRRAGDDTQGRARLVREAQALARLSHPNVCHVYDVGTDGDEVWVAMELVDGVTLRQWAGPHRSRGELLAVLVGAAQGIAAAHEAGLVHRDVKPENVLINRDGRAIVTDFGLARAADGVDPVAATQSPDPHLTATGAIAGTPAYIAPEQMTGDPIDARADQFAWAVMAWELLVGARPLPIVLAARLEAVQRGVAPPPQLPPRLGSALVRALACVPRDRHASMRALIDAVNEAANEAARPPSRATPARRRRTAAFTGLAVLGGAAVAAGAWTFTRGDGDPPATVASAKATGSSAPATDATGSSTLATGSSALATGSSALAAGSSALATGSSTRATNATGASAHATGTGSSTTATDSSASRTNTPTTVATAAPPAARRLPDPSSRVPPAPGSGSTAEPAVTVVGTTAPAPARRKRFAIRPYDRATAIMTMSAECRIPIDPKQPGRGYEVVDWGRVTKIADETGTLRGGPHNVTIITVAGARTTYRMNDDQLVGLLDVNVGDLVAVCPMEAIDIYRLPGGPISPMRSVVTLSAPPRVAELARFAPQHISEAEVRAASSGKLGRLGSGRYLASLTIAGGGGDRWEIDVGATLVIPAGVAAGSLAPKARRWIVFEKGRFEDDPLGGTPRLTLDAVHVIDELFP